ncbi:MAG: hypothetical protein GY842_09625, partial [bacterium]|nr:hypothetical protein [bacterium]
YDIYLVAEDDESSPNTQSGVTKLEVVTVPDITAPDFAPGYPKAENVTENALDLVVQLDEIGTAYYVVLADGAAAPTPAEVEAGTGSAGETAIESGSIDVTAADTDTVTSLTGLEEATAYDIYLAAEDDESSPNLQSAVTILEVATMAAPDTSAPGVPDLVSPSNGAAVDAPVVLQWNKASDPDGDAVTHQYYVCEDDSFAGCDPVTATMAGLFENRRGGSLDIKRFNPLI